MNYELRLLNLGNDLCKKNADLLTSKEEADGTVFICPLEYTHTSPITVEDDDVVLDDVDVRI